VLRSVPGVSHALDGFRRCRPRGLVSSRSHVQDFPSGVCPSPRSRTGFRRPDALVPLDRFACGCPRRKTDRRLQGLAPRAECGGLEGGLDLRNSAPLVGVSSFGCSPCPPWQRFRAASACGLHRIEPDARDPGRLAGEQVGWRGITLPTRSRFST
jgi:hypothetical protein